MKNARVDGLPLPHESLYSSKFNWKNLAIGRALIACAASTAYVAWYHQNPDKEEDTDHTYEIFNQVRDQLHHSCFKYNRCFEHLLDYLSQVRENPGFLI